MIRTLSALEKVQLFLQKILGWIFLLPMAAWIVSWLRFGARYEILNLGEVRRAYREFANHGGPILICGNHLTFIDSVLMHWAFGSIPWYLLHYRCFAWNLPAGDYFKRYLHFRLIGTLSKCLFIDRGGAKEHIAKVLSQTRYLLSKGEAFMVFPEGRRSRMGRFESDRVTHGVGAMIEGIPNLRVVAVYLRGDRQRSFSNYPARGSRFEIEMTEVPTELSETGRKAQGVLAERVKDAIVALENRYFERHPELRP